MVRPGNETPISLLRDTEITKADCAALQAVASGTANEGQQKRAMAAILHICGINNMTWMPDEHGGDRETSFAAGKQHVGFQIRKLVTHPLDVLTGERQAKRGKAPQGS